MMQVWSQHNIRIASRRYAAPITLKTEVLSRIEGHHLNSDDGIEAEAYRMTQHAIHVSLVKQCSGMDIISAKNKRARVQTLLCDRRDLGRYVMPGRPQAQHRAHT